MKRITVNNPHLLYPISIFGGLAVWEIIARSLPRTLLAPPTAVGLRLWEMIGDGSIPVALASSLQHMLAGYLLAVLVAVPLGIALGRSPSLSVALDPVLNAIYAIPSVAFIPFLIVWFGLYFEGRVALVFLMCFFEILMNVQQGVRDIDRGLLDAGHSLQARGLTFFWLVLLPASLPFIFTGLRVGIGRAVNAMITAELFFAAVNLGKLMKVSGNAFDTASLFAVIFVVSVLGLIGQETVGWLDRRLLTWHHRDIA
ncbi:MAG: ABC transporter permease [SAR324 cluster bacterium]|nr:ABC transporter permease [SAR324 cluster bacterium]MCZ6841465.1 ABC transporter permease [SAR324 cluster bacterium]